MIPHEKTLVERLKNEPFALLGINTDKDKDEYHKLAAEQGVIWRSSWQGATSGVWPTAWGVNAFPTIYVLDAQGVIRFIGPRGAELDRAVDGLLEELKKSKNAPAAGR